MGGSTTLLLVILIIVLSIGTISLAVLLVRLQKKLAHFMLGSDANTLESVLEQLVTKTNTIEEVLETHQEGLEYIDSRVKRSIRGYSLVRYNAYNDAGGEQSFASGLLDEYGDGYVLSVITNRNHVGVYAKKVLAFTPEAPLTEEEQAALTAAKDSISQ